MSPTTKKFFVDKNETAADLIQRIVNTREKNIVIVIPKDATLKKSLKNFHLLKQETMAAEKNIVIESVDEEVLAFAGASAIESNHPLFAESAHQMSDIVPRTTGKKVKVAEAPEEGKLPDGIRREMPSRFFRDESPEERGSSSGGAYPARFFGSRTGRIVIAIIILAVAAFFIVGHFAKATIMISLKHAPFSYEGDITVTPQITSIVHDKDQIPGELFTNQKNFTQLFLATGHSDSRTLAKGTITIWNAYSSAPQTLVATTRFESPDHKIFRLDKTIVVPGAHVVKGKITPSAIDGSVTADAAGPDSNVGPVAKLMIPGFKGSPREGGFYGELKTGTSGGSVGGKAVATPDDIAQAKAKSQNILGSDLRSITLASLPDGFTILDGASQISTSKISVNSQTDDKGNFSVFAEATLQAIGFRVSDLTALLLTHADQNSSYHENLLNPTMHYAKIIPDYAHGTLVFHLQAQGDAVPDFSSTTFVASIAGKSEHEARAAVLNIPGLVDAKISLWPIWETQMPVNPGRITVDVK